MGEGMFLSVTFTASVSNSSSLVDAASSSRFNLSTVGASKEARQMLVKHQHRQLVKFSIVNFFAKVGTKCVFCRGR